MTKFKDDLMEVRLSLANLAFEHYEFGSGINVEASNGWTDQNTEDWIKIVFIHFDDDGPNEPTHKVSFHVVFTDDDDFGIQEVYALLVESGDKIGRWRRM